MSEGSTSEVRFRFLLSAALEGLVGMGEERKYAFRDDTTINVQIAPALPAGPVSGPAAVPATPAAAPPATPSYPLPLSNFAQNYRTAYSATPGAYTQNLTTPITQRTQTGYQASPISSYAQWFAQHQTGSLLGQPSTPVRVSTPQTGTPAQPTGSTYFPYGGAGMGMANATPSRAVANTLVGKLQAATGVPPRDAWG